MINLATIFCRGIFIISVVEINACGRDNCKIYPSKCTNRCTTTAIPRTRPRLDTSKNTVTTIPLLYTNPVTSKTPSPTARYPNTTAIPSSTEQKKETCRLGCIATLTVISVGCIVASITGTVVCCIVRAPKAASANEPPVVSYIDHVGYDSLQARYFEMDGTYTSLRYDEDAILQTITGNNDMPTYCTIIE